MAVDWGVKSYERRLCQGELDLVSLVVPQVIHPEALLVMEVLLCSIVTLQVSWAVQGSWQFLVVASQRLVECLFIYLSALLGANKELVVRTPMSLCILIWWSLLEQPDSKVGSWLETKYSEHLVVRFLSSNQADTRTRRTKIALDLLPACFVKRSSF